MIDQARSIRDQLRAVEPVRVALALLTEDADALAARVDGALVAAEVAWVAATRQRRAQRGSWDAAKRVVASSARWLAALDACLRIGEASLDAAVTLACAQVRAVIPRERRSLVGARRTAEAVVPLLGLHAVTLAHIPGMSLMTEQGEALELELKARQRALDEADAAFKVALATAKRRRLALLETLRDVRRLWASASRIAEVPVPALDLRIGKSAVAAAERAEVEASEVEADGAQVPPEGEAPAVDGLAPAGEVEGGEAGDDPGAEGGGCARPKVVAQVVVAVG